MVERVDQALGADELQEELRDLLCLAVVGDHVRLVVRGDGAAEFAEWLAEAVAEWRRSADRVAKRLVEQGLAPDARVRSLAKDIPLNWVPDGWLRPEEGRELIADRVGTLAEWARYRRSQAGDRETMQLLDAVCSNLEAWTRP